MKQSNDDRHVTPESEDSKPERNEPIKVPVIDPMRRRRGVWRKIAIGLLICLVIAGLVAAFLWMNRSSDKIKIRALQSDVTSLNKRLAMAQREQDALENRIAGMRAVAAVGQGNDEEQIVAATRVYARTFVEDGATLAVEVSKRDGSEAVAVLRHEGTKYNIYLKKAGEIWQPVWAGKGSPAENTRKQYNLTIE